MAISGIIISFVVGSVFGSFFNVVIYRIPNSISLITPPSHCPVCGKNLKWYHNIPLLSYIFLGGKCAYCNSKISISYFLVELFTANAFLLLFLKDGFSMNYIFNLTIFSILLIQSFIDFKYMEVPAILNDILIGAGVVYLIFNYSFFAIIFSLLTTIFFLVLYLFYKNKFGIGDAKIFIALSMFFGYDLIYIILISSLAGLFVAFIISINKKVTFTSLRLPFIPYIFIGVVAYWIILSVLRMSTLINFNI